MANPIAAQPRLDQLPKNIPGMEDVDFAEIRIREWHRERQELVHLTEGQSGGERLQRIQEIAIERQRRPKTQDDRAQREHVTWIHIPRNNMQWCEAIISLLCEHTQGQVDEMLGGEKWIHQLHDTLDVDQESGYNRVVEAPYLDPASFRTFFVMENGYWRSQEAKPRNQKYVSSTALFMPYMHWNSVREQQSALSARFDNAGGRSDDHRNDHPRRSLDEAGNRYHTYEGLARRNEDQVVTRYLWQKQKKKDERALKLIVVDQLWMWVLDEETLVTSFPGGCCHEPQLPCPELHLECLIQSPIQGEYKDRGLNAFRMLSYIIYRSITVFTHPRNSKNFRFIDIFERAISDERSNCTDLLRVLEGKTPVDPAKGRMGDDDTLRAGSSKRNLISGVLNRLDIQGDISAVGKIRDIIEELHIMLYIVNLQMTAVKSTQTVNYTAHLPALKERLEGMVAQAAYINDMLFQTLELKQTQLSVRQNQVVIAFTIVTIIFLPPSFVSSIFGMNASELTDGSPVGLRRIFTYMFPISVAISGFALVLAFGSDIVAVWRVLWNQPRSGRSAQGIPPPRGLGAGRRRFVREVVDV